MANRAPLLGRTNMAEVNSEGWRPPLFAAPTNSPIGILLARLRRFLDIQAGSVWRDVATVLPAVRGRILDVGCGAQPYRPLVHPEATYMAIDTDDAKPRFGYDVPDTTYFSGKRWPVADGSVDFVLTTETMEHVLDTRGFLSEASRCLRQGGGMLLTVPFSARWHFVPFDYWRFTPSSLDHLLRESGFTDVEVCARGNAGTVACYKAMALMLPLLAPQSKSMVVSLLLRLVGVILIPVVVLLAVVANVTLSGRGGDDCLGYTVIVRKSDAPVRVKA